MTVDESPNPETARDVKISWAASYFCFLDFLLSFCFLALVLVHTNEDVPASSRYSFQMLLATLFLR
jgi:hypothetical protein